MLVIYAVCYYSYLPYVPGKYLLNYYFLLYIYVYRCYATVIEGDPSGQESRMLASILLIDR